VRACVQCAVCGPALHTTTHASQQEIFPSSSSPGPFGRKDGRRSLVPLLLLSFSPGFSPPRCCPPPFLSPTTSPLPHSLARLNQLPQRGRGRMPVDSGRSPALSCAACSQISAPPPCAPRTSATFLSCSLSSPSGGDKVTNKNFGGRNESAYFFEKAHPPKVAGAQARGGEGGRARRGWGDGAGRAHGAAVQGARTHSRTPLLRSHSRGKKTTKCRGLYMILTWLQGKNGVRLSPLSLPSPHITRAALRPAAAG
jgi:hypothetical protein